MKYIKLYEDHISMYHIFAMTKDEIYDTLAKEIQKEEPNIELVQNILEYGDFDINAYYDHFYDDDYLPYVVTLLMAACYYGEDRIVEEILKQPNVDVNKGDKEDNDVTAIICAFWGNNIECIRLLLEHPDFELDIVDDMGYTPLMYAVQKGRIEIIRLFLNHPKIDSILDHRAHDGKTAWDKGTFYIQTVFPELNPDGRVK